MGHKLINIGQYILLICDDEIKVGDLFYLDNADFIAKFVSVKPNIKAKKIIGHLPLKNSPIFEGIPLLPPLEQEDDVKKLAENEYREFPSNPKDKPDWHYNKDINCGRKRKAFIKGYNKAKEKYIGILKEIEKLCNNQNPEHEEIWRLCYFFSQPKLPIGFKCEVETKTTINSQGQEVLVGEYIY